MKPSDIEKTNALLAQYKEVVADCDSLFNISAKLAEAENKSLHVSLLLNGLGDFPKIQIMDASDLTATLDSIMKEKRNRSASTDLNHEESFELIRLILKIKTAHKNALQKELNDLGVEL